MSPRRFLFVLWAANLGGVQSSVVTRIRALRGLGVQSDVLFYHDGAGRASFAGVNTYVSSKPSALAALLKRRAYSVVSFINVKPLVDVLRGVKYRGRMLYELRGLSERGLSICSRLSAAECSAVVVPSRYVARLVRRARPDARLPVHVVYNAVDTALFRPLRAFSAGPYDDGRNRPVLLWVGRLDWNKNFIELLRIVLCLRERGVHVSPWVVSDVQVSKYVHRFRQALRVTGLEKEVRLLADVPRRDMPLLYNFTAASGGCLVSTSRSEGLQNALLEGMACGCPVVTAAVGGNVEIVSDGRTGATYPLGRPDMAADQIARLLTDAALRRRYVAQGLKAVSERFSPTRHAQAFLEMVMGIPPVRGA